MKMRCIKKVVWENHGQAVIAFFPGDVVDVTPSVYEPVSGIAASPYFKGVSDFVPLASFEPISDVVRTTSKRG